MSNFLTGKYYNLQFSDEFADGQAAANINMLCGDYKLIGTGMIPSSNNRMTFEYYLFKNCDTEKMIEVYRDGNKYHTLIFCIRDEIITKNYSDYLDYGWEDFPNFAGPHCDCILNVTITETDME